MKNLKETNKHEKQYNLYISEMKKSTNKVTAEVRNNVINIYIFGEINSGFNPYSKCLSLSNNVTFPHLHLVGVHIIFLSFWLIFTLQVCTFLLLHFLFVVSKLWVFQLPQSYLVVLLCICKLPL